MRRCFSASLTSIGRACPRCAKRDREAAVPGGNISSIDVDRPSTQGEAKPVRWKFDVRAGILGESSTVEFDAKSGALARLNSPKSRQG